MLAFPVSSRSKKHMRKHNLAINIRTEDIKESVVRPGPSTCPSPLTGVLSAQQPRFLQSPEKH